MRDGRPCSIVQCGSSKVSQGGVCKVLHGTRTLTLSLSMAWLVQGEVRARLGVWRARVRGAHTPQIVALQQKVAELEQQRQLSCKPDELNPDPDPDRDPNPDPKFQP